MGQLPLFGHGGTPRIDASFAAAERIVLAEGAWLDVVRGWVREDAALFELLYRSVAWRSESRVMYDRTVEVPRRYAVLRDGGAMHPVFGEMRAALDDRYTTAFERLSLALYRDGRDSVAWHGDYVARRMPEALVATISVGAPRKFLVRPTGGGASIALSLGFGDLLVMGGSCQRTHQHAIPKVTRADPRIAIMFRPVWQAKDPDAPPTNEQAANDAQAERGPY
jgi:alkylated DNA repair dioxygenase AlkB